MGTSFRAYVREIRQTWTAELPDLVVLEAVDSTNRLGRRILENQEEPSRHVPVLVVAFEQTSGRGRQGRYWSSPPGGGVYASLVLDLSQCAVPAPLLPLAVGVALCESLQAWIRVGLKWPNDLVVSGSKLGGILIDVVGSDPPCAVIGFGINVGDGAKSDPRANAPATLASVATASAVPTAGSLVRVLTRSLLAKLHQTPAESSLIDDYRIWSDHAPGDQLRWHGTDRLVEGTFEGLDDSGHLLLRSQAGLQRFAAGEIVVSSHPRDGSSDE